MAIIRPVSGHRRELIWLLMLVLVVLTAGDGIAVAGLAHSGGRPPIGHRSTADLPLGYDRAVLALNPVVYFHLSGTSRDEADLAASKDPGEWSTDPMGLPKVALPDGADALDVGPGVDLTVPSVPGLSVSDTGELTVVSWMRPDTLEFAKSEGSGYVYWIGKGADGQQEWALRMYNRTNEEHRPNRISGYVFNPSGGEGSGSYFEDPEQTGVWLMVTMVVSLRPSFKFPTGWVAIYKNSIRRATTSLGQFNVRPAAGDAPMRVGTRDRESWFQGAIGDVAVYDHALTSGEIAGLYAAMTGHPLPD